MSTVRSGVHRRAALASLAAVSVAGFAAPALAAAALDAPERLRIYKGKYAIPGGNLIEGYFVSPRGRQKLDMVVLIPGESGYSASLETAARQFAHKGKMVIMPDLPATYPNQSSADRATMAAAIRREASNLGRMPLCSGAVDFVAMA